MDIVVTEISVTEVVFTGNGCNCGILVTRIFVTGIVIICFCKIRYHGIRCYMNRHYGSHCYENRCALNPSHDHLCRSTLCDRYHYYGNRCYWKLSREYL